MAETASSYVVEFGTDATGPAIPVHKVYAVPANPAVGEPYEIRAVAEFAITIQSPYAAATGSRTDAAATVTETLELGGNTSPSPEFPVASIGSAVARTPVVDAEGTIRAAAGASVRSLLGVANGALTTEAELWGSVDLTYTSYAAVVAEFSGQPVAGEYVYLAQAAELEAPEHVVVTVGEANAGQGPAYRITTNPASPVVDQAFEIDVRAAAAFTVTSPYGLGLTPSNGAAETVTTTVALGGNAQVNPEQPVASLLSATVVTPVVDEAGSIVAAAGAAFDSDLTVRDGSLYLAGARWGSVALEFLGFPPQLFAVSGLSPAGEYLFTADSESLPDPVPFAVAVAEVSTSWSWSTVDSGAARLVSLYVRPWRATVDFHHAGGSHAEFVYQGIETETVEELVEIVDGQGTASKSVLSVLDSEWRYTDLGAITTTEDGAVSSGTVGNSMVWLQYTTRKHVWRGTADVEQVLVWIEG